MEDVEQLWILPASTQRPWMEPLWGMNGSLCHFGEQWSKPENTSELSHEVRPEHTPWRRARMAKVWVCAANPLQKYCVWWHSWKNRLKKKFVYHMQEPWWVVLGCPCFPFSGNRPFTDWTFVNYLIVGLIQVFVLYYHLISILCNLDQQRDTYIQ